MKYNYLNLVAGLACLIVFNSCTDVVDIDVPNGGERLVVEASINWEKGTTGEDQIIKLSTSTTYFSNPEDAQKPITGASVRIIRDRDGTSFYFNDLNNGTYSCNNFEPELNQGYTLEIANNGSTYTAHETMISVADIKRIEQEESSFGDDEIVLKVYFDDPVSIDNFYLVETKLPESILPILSVSNDEFSDGNESFIDLETESDETGEEVEVTLNGISDRYYNYMSILLEQAGGEGGGPFTTIPVRLKGNCSSMNDPNEEVLGYFKLSEVVKSTYTIQ